MPPVSDDFGVAVGSTLDDRYVLEGVLGQGGMGVVFQAQQLSIHRPVAVKLLHPSLARSPEFYERFRREAELASKLRHPHIIQIHDFGQTANGACYYVMELVEGVCLRELVTNEGPFSLRRTAEILDQLARALGHAHAAGVIHRDLKPRNVMCTVVDGHDFTKILDFGLVKMTEAVEGSAEAGELTRTGEVLGTPAYMAPEQAAGEPVDQRADVYSLGVVAYCMLTGTTPYAKKTVKAALLAAATLPVPPASSHRPDAPLPEGVEAFLRRAIAYDPDARPASMEAFLLELKEALAGVPEDALDRRPSSAPPVAERPKGPVRSAVTPFAYTPSGSRTGPAPRASWRRILAIGAGAFVLAGVGGAAWGWLGGRLRLGGKDAEPAAPLLVPAAASRVKIQLEYGTEKKRWLEAQVASFRAAHPEIDVELVGKGSLEIAERLGSGADQPTLVSPADSMALSLAEAAWEKRNGGARLIAADGTQDAPESLVLTPLVFVVWADRAPALKKLAQGELGWRALHDAIGKPGGWAGLSGKREWGAVKLGLTDPVRSNSGFQALLMMALEYFHKTSGLAPLEVQDRGLARWLGELRAGAPRLESSTGVLMSDFVQYGPSRYDVAVVYESLAIDQLEGAENHWGAVRVAYPPVTSWSNHPIALLRGPWVSEEQKKAARELVAFLRAKPAQEQALAFGFRPADPGISLAASDPKNPFVRFAKQGIRVSVPTAAVPPGPDVIEELLHLWTTQVQPATP